METIRFPDTSASLLSLLRREPRNPEAWKRFVDTYGPRIHEWCLRWGLQDADARDVTQAVLLRFFNRAEHFDYDRSRRFRGWLRALAQSSWREFVKSRRGENQGRGGDGTGPVDWALARDELTELIDAEFNRQALRAAMDEVRSRVETHTWEAFRLFNEEGLTGEDVADRLGMRVGSAYAASSKVRRLIREELCRREASDR
jgi:RNA polymerase sigma factor (sigma-70 family)